MSDRILRGVAAGVALLGLAVAGYLTWAHYADTAVICVAGGGCETVQSSDYAVVAGIPVSVLGIAAYATILALVLWDAPVARLGAAGLALVGLVFSLYLLGVQLFVIGAICSWCIVNDVLVAPTLAAVTAWRLRGAR